MRALVLAAKSTRAAVGWKDESDYPDDRGGLPVAVIAAIMDKGNAEKGLPPRPIMEPTRNANESKWVDTMRKEATAITAGKRTVQQAFSRIGLQAQGDLQQTILAVTEPPLAESTLRARARRKHTTLDAVPKKPLEDSGLLLATVTHEVITT